MCKQIRLVLIVFVSVLGGVSLVLVLEKVSSLHKNQDQPSLKYEAEEGVPKDTAAEKRRDYAVLEAALNDLASPRNPEYKYHIQNVGPGREIVIDDNTYKYDTELRDKSTNIDHTDTRSIPADIQDDFKRRKGEPARSLADFQPVNPNIIVRDLDKMFKTPYGALEAFDKKYPTAWGYVWAYPPAYSRDGKTAVVLFEGGPNGEHGLNWVYMLARKGKRWDVQ
jgi:hypothetical protein